MEQVEDEEEEEVDEKEEETEVKEKEEEGQDFFVSWGKKRQIMCETTGLE